MKTMTQKPELKEGQVRAAEIVELNANEVQAVSGGISWGFAIAYARVRNAIRFARRR